MQLITHIWAWGNHLIAQLGGRTIATLLGALVVAFASVMFNDNWIVSISRQVETIRTVRINIEILHQLKANLYEAESAQRGYMLTKRAEYLAPFNNALKQARMNIAQSESFVKQTSSIIESSN